jgi:hypothetical protein
MLRTDDRQTDFRYSAIEFCSARTIAADSHVTDEILRPQREGFGCFALTTDKQISDIPQLNFAAPHDRGRLARY